MILYADGTWKYANDKSAVKDAAETKPDTSKINFTKTEASSFQVTSSKIGCSIYLNPKKWSFEKSKEGAASEFEFTLKDKDAYGMLITEKIEIPKNALKTAALNNAKEVAPDIKIIKEEYRKVNGKYMLMMEMSGTINGIKFTYFGYYYSSEKGTAQLLTYTSANLVNEFHDDLEEFLDGFVCAEK